MDIPLITKVLEEVDSPINGRIRVVKDLAWGTHIQANGLTQSGGVVESIWKSTLRQIPTVKRVIHSKFQNPNCLILGLGGGTAAKLVRKQWPEAKIVGVDVDPVMVEMGKKYLGLEKAGVEIITEDAEDFIKKNKGKYDLIVVDLYQGDKYPEKFESHNFLSRVECSLTYNGIAVFNRLYFADKRPGSMRFLEKLEKVFPKVDIFHPEANVMFICFK